ncbi:hypothetical protein AAFN88_11510 [Pelagibius sp. CAU 1746]|uniref:hypothetical protein n=1 Tax=Pelagibius sp. CAU 1746 TaxID=3140370 RepID=UPI00325A78D6
MDDKGIEARDSAGAPGSEIPDSGIAATEEHSAKSAVKQVAETSLPLEVGSVVLGEDGHIRHFDEDRPLHFRFSACGIDFEADLASKAAPLRLRANLGKLPFSAESPDGRRLARTVMAATDRLRRGHILLSEDQDMVLEGELNPPSPRTPVAVIATAVALIIDFKPYLDLLGEAVALRRPPPMLPGEEAAAPAEA